MWILHVDDRAYNSDHFSEIIVDDNRVVGYSTTGMATVISERAEMFTVITEAMIKNKKYVVVD